MTAGAKSLAVALIALAVDCPLCRRRCAEPQKGPSALTIVELACLSQGELHAENPGLGEQWVVSQWMR